MQDQERKAGSSEVKQLRRRPMEETEWIAESDTRNCGKTASRVGDAEDAGTQWSASGSRKSMTSGGAHLDEGDQARFDGERSTDRKGASATGRARENSLGRRPPRKPKASHGVGDTGGMTRVGRMSKSDGRSMTQFQSPAGLAQSPSGVRRARSQSSRSGCDQLTSPLREAYAEASVGGSGDWGTDDEPCFPRGRESNGRHSNDTIDVSAAAMASEQRGAGEIRRKLGGSSPRGSASIDRHARAVERATAAEAMRQAKLAAKMQRQRERSALGAGGEGGETDIERLERQIASSDSAATKAGLRKRLAALVAAKKRATVKRQNEAREAAPTHSALTTPSSQQQQERQHEVGKSQRSTSVSLGPLVASPVMARRWGSQGSVAESPPATPEGGRFAHRPPAQVGAGAAPFANEYSWGR